MFPRRQLFSNKRSVFSTQSVPICYKQYTLGEGYLDGASVGELARGPLRFSCELLLLEAGIRGVGPFGNPEEGERPPFEAVTKQRQW
jgi:hypothetical protein